ncbi:MAG: hypothetical protein GY795_09065 [Desulfobacterales bacterium]|nr:hypothetical protein [Desulfobacterales bacterium]
MNLSEIDLAFLERECRITLPKMGDASLRKKIQGLDVEISDIYPVSGEAVKVWQTVDLNPDLLSLSGEYNEIQLKENIILPILSLAKHGISSFLIAKCPEYPLLYEDEQVKLEGLADLVYGKAPVAMATYLEYPLIYVHEYKRISNPVKVSDALAQLLGGMWIIARHNQAKGFVYPVYGLMVKGQNWHFAELHTDESLEDGQRYKACLDSGGFSIEPDLDVILKGLRYYFFEIHHILEDCNDY